MRFHNRIFVSLSALFLTVKISAQEVQSIEYFFDSEPGHGKGIKVASQTGENILNVPVKHLEPGMHLICFRSQDTEGAWSSTLTKPVFVLSDKSDNVSKIEYFFDNDPGHGQGTKIGAENGGNGLAVIADTLKPGIHMLCVRSQDTEGKWSSTLAHPIYVIEEKPKNAECLEYFFDKDPGFGNGIQISDVSNENGYSLSLSGIEDGAHTICLRAKDNMGNWSSVWSRMIYVYTLPKITQVEYFIDDDPGVGNAVQVPLSPAANSECELAFNVNMDELPVGNHQLCVRAKDNLGKWSVLSQEPFSIIYADGVNEIVWNQRINVECIHGRCRISREDASELCKVELHTISGQLIGESEWSEGESSLEFNSSIHKGEVIIVSVYNPSKKIKTVKRVLAR